MTHLKLRYVMEVLREVALSEGRTAGKALCEDILRGIKVCVNALLPQK